MILLLNSKDYLAIEYIENYKKLRSIMMSSLMKLGHRDGKEVSINMFSVNLIRTIFMNTQAPSRRVIRK